MCYHLTLNGWLTLPFLRRRDTVLRRRQVYGLILRLGYPAILAQVATVAMQYIDTMMVGHLGASATASVGVVISSTWIAVGLIHAVAVGFSVQVAHAFGAQNFEQAKKVFREGGLICLLFSCLLAIICLKLSRYLPRWLGAEEGLWASSSMYFFIYACSIPAVQLRVFSGAVLQCMGNTKIPGLLNAVLCLMDVIFNSLLIFPNRMIAVGGFHVTLPGANLGVAGAALGTALSEGIVAIAMLRMAFRVPQLRFEFSSWCPSKRVLKTAFKISLPMAVESVAKDGAHIFLTGLVAPLGAMALASDTLAFTIEQLCYLPGLGMSIVATTLVGQALGAGRRDLAQTLAWSTVQCGVLLVTAVAIFIYAFAPTLLSLFTTDAAVQRLGAQVLRIVLLAEPLISASVVIAGALRGAKDTFIPCIIIILCKWGIVLPLASLLVKQNGLVGVWIGMATEFCVRGVLFLTRLKHEKSWLKRGD